ncbi:MAG: hypothetical protein E5V95_35335 [Mesorhizobium sp.]|nr:MAG: hypothetical protein E5V95_35335 [Mesorhizobium sp.]
MDDEAVGALRGEAARGLGGAGEFALGAVGFEVGGHGSGAEERNGIRRTPSSFAPLSVLPDISPSRGEIGSLSAGTSLATVAIGETGGDI